MEITDIRFKLSTGTAVKAYFTLTFDDVFVIHDCKVIDGPNGLFVAMPSRKVSDRCPECGSKNPITARYCGDCGSPQVRTSLPLGADGRPKIYADIVHPINSTYRGLIEDEVLRAYHAEVRGVEDPRADAKQPTLREVVRAHVLAAVERNNGRKDDAARDLGVSLKTIYNKLHEYEALEAA